MATVKEIKPQIKSQEYVENSIKYILAPENRNGDEKCFTSTCLNCNGSANNLALQFSLIRMQYGKDKNILSHHYVQSFSPNEKITPELAHKIAVELMNKVSTGFQVVVSTHIDKDHIHNHIIINSVNMETGMKWKGNGDTLNNMRNESDRLCRQYGLSTIQKKSGLRGIDQTTQKLAEKGQSWKVDLCNALDEVTSLCNRKDNFIHYMEVKGFKITRYGEKDITFQKIGETKKIRASTLAKQFGEVYTKENIEKKMSIYRLPKPSERTPVPKKKNVKSPFINEFEKFERDYFSKNPPLAKIVETRKFQNQIESSSRPLVTLMSIIFNLFFRRKRRNTLDANYRKLQKHGAYQTVYKKYVPSLEEQVRRIERLQKTAGNISYHQLISSQGENYKVAIPLSSVPKLYAYNFFFSARLFNDKAMVTIKEKDKYLLQMALGIENIQSLERHNKYYKPKSDYAEMKERAKQIGSKIEYLMIEPEQLEKLKDETDRFIKFDVGEKIRLVFLEENKKFILQALYPDKYKSDNLFSVSRNSKVNTRLKAEILLGGQKMMYRTLSREQVEQLAENTKGQELFAVFNKNAKGESLGEDKYNVAFKSSDEEKIETALKSDTKPKRKL